MFIIFSRRRLAGPIAPVALTFQCFAALAMPLALCCCLSMAAEGSVHSSGRADHSAPGPDSGGEACPLHDLAPGKTSDSSTGEAGCQYVDRLVIALAGLIGVASPPPEFAHTLSLSGPVRSWTQAPDDGVLSVESPPPRA